MNIFNFYNIIRGDNDRLISSIIGASVYIVIFMMIFPPIIAGIVFGGIVDGRDPSFIVAATSDLETIIPDFALLRINGDDAKKIVSHDSFILFFSYWMYVSSYVGAIIVFATNIAIARRFMKYESEYSKFLFGKSGAAIGIITSAIYCAYVYSGAPLHTSIVNYGSGFGSNGVFLEIFMTFFGVIFFSLFSSLAVSKEIFRN